MTRGVAATGPAAGRGAASLPDRPARRARRHRPRPAARRRAPRGLARRPHRLARRREAPRHPRPRRRPLDNRARRHAAHGRRHRRRAGGAAAACRALRRRDRRAGAAEVGAAGAPGRGRAASSGWPAGTCASLSRAGPTTTPSSRAGPHVVDHALALARGGSARPAGPPRFALQPPASDVVARVRGALGLGAGSAVRGDQPRRGVAEQALAARTLRRRRARICGRATGGRRSWPGAPARRISRARSSPRPTERAALAPHDVARRAPGHRRRGRPRRLRGHRSAAPGRGAGHADRRDLRPDRSGPQRTVVAGRRHALAQPRLRMPPSAPVHRRGVVPGAGSASTR